MISKIDRDKINKYIRSYVEGALPEFIYSLNMYLRKFSDNNDCIDLLLNEPWTLRDVLVRLSGSVTAVKVLSRVLLYPIKLEAKTNRALEELVNLFIDNPSELYKIIQESLLRN